MLNAIASIVASNQDLVTALNSPSNTTGAGNRKVAEAGDKQDAL